MRFVFRADAEYPTNVGTGRSSDHLPKKGGSLDLSRDIILKLPRVIVRFLEQIVLDEVSSPLST
jgi:hypothetical protein